LKDLSSSLIKKCKPFVRESKIKTRRSITMYLNIDAASKITPKDKCAFKKL